MAKSSKNRAPRSEEYLHLATLIQEENWEEVRKHLFSDTIGNMTSEELYVASLGTVLSACKDIPVGAKDIPDHYVTFFERYLELGIDINSVSPQGTTIMTSVSKAFQPLLIRYFIDKGADVNLSGAFGPPLMGVCAHAATLVLGEGFSEDDRNLYRPLAYESAQILLENGADPNFVHKAGTCIVQVIQTNWIDFNLLFLDYGAKFVDQPKHTTQICLEQAIQFTSPELLEILFAYGLSPEIPLERKMIPLNYAKKNGKQEMAEVIEKALAHKIPPRHPTKSTIRSQV